MALMDRIRLVWTGVAGAPYYTSLYFTADVSSGGAAATHDAVADAFTLLRPVWSSGLTATVESEILTIDSSTGDAVSAQSVPAVAIVGTAANALMPRATQGLVRLRTGVFQNGRRLNGRLFVPGVTISANNAGVPSVSYQTSLRDALQPLANLESPEWLVWSRLTGNVAAITQVAPWTEFASLRSRRD